MNCDDEDVDLHALWKPVLEAADEVGLLDHPAGTVGDSWDRYTSLWITYTQSGGFFMDKSIAEDLDHGVLLTLKQTPDGPLRGPVALATLLLAEASDEQRTELLWELVEEHEVTLALIGMHWLADGGVPASAFDHLGLEGEPELELFRRRLHLEDAQEAGEPRRIRAAAASLAAHPEAAPEDLLDVEELVFALQADRPSNPWEKALQEEVWRCADVAAGDVVDLTVRSGQWSVEGVGATADCLFGWSWPDPVDDQRLELRVIR